MRVIFLSTYNEPCGIATYTEALASHLAKVGVERHVIAPKRAGKPEADGPERLWSGHAATRIEAAATLGRVRRLRPHVVHVQNEPGLFSARFLAVIAAGCRLLGIAMAATLHARFGDDPKRNQRLWRQIRALGGSPLVVHNASHRRELLMRRQVEIIPHGVHPPGPRPAPGALIEAKRALGLDPRLPVLAHFGFLHPHKGVLQTLEAIAELRQGGRALHYLVCGGSTSDPVSRAYVSALRERISQLGLEPAVTLEDQFLDEPALMARLRAADWIILNYQDGGDQGTSGAARHALRSGRPVAVSPADIFEDVREAAHTIEAPLARSIGRLLDDEALADETAERGRCFCEAHSWSRVAGRHLELYERMVGRG